MPTPPLPRASSTTRSTGSGGKRETALYVDSANTKVVKDQHRLGAAEARTPTHCLPNIRVLLGTDSRLPGGKAMRGPQAVWTRVLAFLACCASLSACSEEPATIAQIIGSYRGKVPAGDAILKVNADGTWEYEIEPGGGKPKFHRFGKWRPEKHFGSDAITLYGFEFGFRRYNHELDPLLKYNWIPLFATPWNPIYNSAQSQEKVYVCIDPDVGPCLKKVGQALPSGQ
jgi:hypothetical protein